MRSSFLEFLRIPPLSGEYDNYFATDDLDDKPACFLLIVFDSRELWSEEIDCSFDW